MSIKKNEFEDDKNSYKFNYEDGDIDADALYEEELKNIEAENLKEDLKEDESNNFKEENSSDVEHDSTEQSQDISDEENVYQEIYEQNDTKKSPIILILGIVGVIAIAIICFLVFKSCARNDGILADIELDINDRIYIDAKNDINVIAIGDGNLDDTNYSLSVSNLNILDISETKAFGSKTKFSIIPKEVGKLTVEISGTLNNINKTKSKELLICKKLDTSLFASQDISISNIETLDLKVDLLSDECNETISYRVSDEDVIKIEDGILTPNKVGTAIVYISDGYNDVELNINIIDSVKTIKVTGITTTDSTLTIDVGSSKKIIASVLPEDATNKLIEYTSSDKSIATVSSNGEIKGIKPGNAVITAKSVDGEFKTTINVTVKNKVTVPETDEKDTIAPIINEIKVYTNNKNNQKYAKTGDIITAEITFSEPLAQIPIITLQDMQAVVTVSNNTYIATVTIPNETSYDGMVDLYVSKFKDKSGNVSSAITKNVSIIISNTLPRCSLSYNEKIVSLTKSGTDIESYYIDKISDSNNFTTNVDNIVVDENGSYYGHIKSYSGLINVCSIVIKTIDNEPPTIKINEESATKYETKKNILVEISDVNGIKSNQYLKYRFQKTNECSSNASDYESIIIPNDGKVNITKESITGQYYLCIYQGISDSNENKTNTYTVSNKTFNFDNTKPSNVSVVAGINRKDVVFTINANDADSGINKYVLYYKFDNATKYEKVEIYKDKIDSYGNNVNYSDDVLEYYIDIPFESKIYSYVYVYDNAGNYTSTSNSIDELTIVLECFFDVPLTCEMIDMNDDDIINNLDIDEFREHYQYNSRPYDINCDGVTNAEDLSLLSKKYNECKN